MTSTSTESHLIPTSKLRWLQHPTHKELQQQFRRQTYVDGSWIFDRVWETIPDGEDKITDETKS